MSHKTAEQKQFDSFVSESATQSQTHTQAVAVSWLVQSLLVDLYSAENKFKPCEAVCVEWMKKYENYPQDSLIASLAEVYKKLTPAPSEDGQKRFMQSVYESYIYDK